MRLMLLIAVPLLIITVPLAAPADEIGLFVDSNYEECTLVDSGTGLVSVYVVHSPSNGSTASQFMLEAGSGVSMTYMGETSPYSVIIGDTQSGISIGYGSCKYTDILVSTVSYYSAGGSSQCSAIKIAVDPSAPSGTIEAINCSFSRLEAIGSRLVINSDGSCACGPSSENTNWGKIKDIYD